MARRRMTLRRIDPWSVLKFGAVVNVCLFVIFLLGSAIVWFAIRQLGIIDQACSLATDVGFENCAVNGGNLFRYLLLLGLLWVVIQTGLFVFFAFLHNLIADLVGGISVTMSEEGTLAGASTRTARTTQRPRTEDRTTGEQPTQRSSAGSPSPHREGASRGGVASSAGSAAGSTAAAAGGSYGSSGGGSDSSTSEAAPTPYDQQAPSAPPTTSPRQTERSDGGSGGWPWDPAPRRETSDDGSNGAQRDEDDDRLFGGRDR